MVLGPSWGQPCAHLGQLGASWMRLASIGVVLGPIWAGFGCIWTPFLSHVGSVFGFKMGSFALLSHRFRFVLLPLRYGKASKPPDEQVRSPPPCSWPPCSWPLLFKPDPLGCDGATPATIGFWKITGGAPIGAKNAIFLNVLHNSLFSDPWDEFGRPLLELGGPEL